MLEYVWEIVNQDLSEKYFFQFLKRELQCFDLKKKRQGWGYMRKQQKTQS